LANKKTYKLIRIVNLITLIILTQSNVANAQSNFEYGFNVGPSNFLGDLGGGAGKGQPFLKDNMIPLTRLMGGFHLGYFVLPYLNFELQYTMGTLEGADSLIKDKGGLEIARKNRNQHFKSPLKEAYLAAKFYPTTLLFDFDPETTISRIRPYFVIGIGMFNFNPQGEFIASNGAAYWVDLKPLRTEGQGMTDYPNRKEYKLTQLNIPYGFGFKYFLSQYTSISFEFINRKTFTDYIDDVSTTYIKSEDFYKFFGATSTEAIIAEQMANKAASDNGGVYKTGYAPGNKRGNPNNTDSYYSSSIKLNIRLRDRSEPRLYRGSQFKCPKF